MGENIPVRVLHLFGPNFGFDFSGHSKRWIWQFNQWNDTTVSHYILNSNKYKVEKTSWINTDRDNLQQNISRFAWTIKTIISLLKNARSYDILHIHNQNWDGLLSGPFLRLLNKKTVFEISLMGSGTPTALSQEKLGHLKLVCFKSMNKFLCISNALKEDCLRNNISGDRIEVVLNPVDHLLFKPVPRHEKLGLRQRNQIPLDKKVILFVGSIKGRKGVDIAFKIFSKLIETRDDCLLLLIGPDGSKQSPGLDDAYVNTIKKKYTHLLQKGDARFIGGVDSRKKLAEYYQLADLFLFPSRSEGLPNVVLESLSSGLPSFVSNLPGITDMLIKDGETGFLFKHSELNGVVNNINFMLSNPKFYREISLSARKFIENNHSFETWQSKMKKFYKSLV